jgi:hypothetical protein
VTTTVSTLGFPGRIGRLVNTPLPESISSVLENGRGAAPSSRDQLALLSLCVGVLIGPVGYHGASDRDAFIKALRNDPQTSLDTSANHARLVRTMVDLSDASSGLNRSFQLMLGALRCAESKLVTSLLDEKTSAKIETLSETITPQMLLVTSDRAMEDLIGKFVERIENMTKAIGRPHANVLEVVIDLLLAMVGPLASIRMHAQGHQAPLAKALTSLCSLLRDRKIPSLGGFNLNAEDVTSLGRLTACLNKLFEEHGSDPAPDRVTDNASLTLQSILRMPASVIEPALERK